MPYSALLSKRTIAALAACLLLAACSRNGRFLSDSDPAYAYLAKQQEACWEGGARRRPWTGSDADVSAVLAMFKKQGERPDVLKEMEILLRRRMPTPFTNPFDYAIQDQLITSIVGASRRLREHFPHSTRLQTVGQPFPPIGSLPLRTISAEAIPVPDDARYVVVLNDGLYAFVEQLARTALAIESAKEVTEESRPREVIAALLEDSKHRARLGADLMLVATGVGLLRDVDPSGDDGRPTFDEWVLALGQVMFVIGHEYSHVLLRHAPVQTREATVGTSTTLQVVARTWRQELEADYVGTILMLDALEHSQESGEGVTSDLPFDQFLFAPSLFLEANGIVDEANDIYATLRVPKDPGDVQVRVGQVVTEQVITDLQRDTDESDELFGALGTDMSKDHPPAYMRRWATFRAFVDWKAQRGAGRQDIDPERTLRVIYLMGDLHRLWRSMRAEFVENCRWARETKEVQELIEGVRRSQ